MSQLFLFFLIKVKIPLFFTFSFTTAFLSLAYSIQNTLKHQEMSEQITELWKHIPLNRTEFFPGIQRI